MEFLIAIALGYLIGSLPAAYILARATKHIDIRAVGSGNVGSSNVGVHAGKLPYIATLGFDLVKGALAVGILTRYNFSFEAELSAGIAAIIGHNWPVWLHFVGGRGIATSFGVLFMFGPVETVLIAILVGIGWRFFHNGASATVIAFALWPVMALIAREPLGVVACGLVVWLIILARRLQGSPGIKHDVSGENMYWNRLWLDRDIQDEEEWVKQGE